MQAAAPLARTTLLTHANGRPLTLPPRPSSIDTLETCEVSGGLPGPHCGTKLDFAPHTHRPLTPCTWHPAPGATNYPADLRTGDRLMGRRGSE